MICLTFICSTTSVMIWMFRFKMSTFLVVASYTRLFFKEIKDMVLFSNMIMKGWRINLNITSNIYYS